MSFIPKNIEKVIEEFNKLPGIGQKSAERLTFYLLRKKPEDVNKFGDAILNLKEGLQYCRVCQNMTTEDVCEICKRSDRNSSIVCVVEEMLDLMALEKANDYKGHYHVLHGVISPIDGIGPDELKIAELVGRIKQGGISELILALNPSLEGEATATYIIRYLEPYNIRVTRIARGIPIGGNLEYADSQTLKRAFEGRVEY